MQMDMRFKNAVGALKMLSDLSFVDLSADDRNFLVQDKLWLAADRNRARRCIEAFAYGALDTVGMPRFPLPAEFIAAAIAVMVSQQNYMVACNVMAGVEWSDDIIMQNSEGVDSKRLFAMVLQIVSGNSGFVDAREAALKQVYGRVKATGAK